MVAVGKMRQQASVRYALDMLDFKAIVKFANRNRFGSRKRNPLYGSKVLETNDLKLDVSDSSTDEFHIKLHNKNIHTNTDLMSAVLVFIEMLNEIQQVISM